MENENVLETPVNENTPDSAQNYIDTINKMRANSVDKTKYDKLLEENRQLLDSLANGETIQVEAQKEKVDLDSLRDSLFNQENNNLDYASKALQLREELIARGEMDPFLPSGHNITPSDADIAAADKVAEALKSCIDYAEGDSEIFTNELQRIMVDSSPIRRSVTGTYPRTRR